MTEVTGIETEVLKKALDSEIIHSSVIEEGAAKIGRQISQEVEAKEVAKRRAKQALGAQIPSTEEAKQ